MQEVQGNATPEVKKPFWGPHRMLQTFEWVKNAVYCGVGSAAIWATSSEYINYEYINAQVALVITMFFNMYYYFNTHMDASFQYKTVLQIFNILLSVWFMISMGAILMKLAISMCPLAETREWGLAVLCEFGLIFLSCSIMTQLVQVLKGLISYSVACFSIYDRNKRRRENAQTGTAVIDQPEAVTQMNSMLERLRKARLQEQNNASDNRV